MLGCSVGVEALIVVVVVQFIVTVFLLVIVTVLVLRSWIHHIGKADEKGYPCGHPLQDSSHLTFSCPLYRQSRLEPIGMRSTLEELDHPAWIKVDEDTEDTVEAYFTN